MDIRRAYFEHHERRHRTPRAGAYPRASAVPGPQAGRGPISFLKVGTGRAGFNQPPSEAGRATLGRAGLYWAGTGRVGRAGKCRTGSVPIPQQMSYARTYLLRGNVNIFIFIFRLEMLYFADLSYTANSR